MSRQWPHLWGIVCKHCKLTVATRSIPTYICFMVFYK